MDGADDAENWWGLTCLQNAQASGQEVGSRIRTTQHERGCQAKLFWASKWPMIAKL